MFRKLIKTTLLIGTGFLPACALFGGGPDITRAEGYRVESPANWSRTEKAESDNAYKTAAGAFVTVTSSCNRNPDAPLEVLTRHLLFGERNYVFEEQTRIQVDGSEGLLSLVKDSGKRSQIYLLLFVLAKSECVFDFSLISPKVISTEEREDFLKFVKSFHYGKN